MAVYSYLWWESFVIPHARMHLYTHAHTHTHTHTHTRTHTHTHPSETEQRPAIKRWCDVIMSTGLWVLLLLYTFEHRQPRQVAISLLDLYSHRHVKMVMRISKTHLDLQKWKVWRVYKSCQHCELSLVVCCIHVFFMNDYSYLTFSCRLH